MYELELVTDYRTCNGRGVVRTTGHTDMKIATQIDVKKAEIQ